MYSNYAMLIYKGEQYKDSVSHIFRNILSVPKSAFKKFIEKTRDYWDTGKEFLSRGSFTILMRTTITCQQQNSGIIQTPRVLKFLH